MTPADVLPTTVTATATLAVPITAQMRPLTKFAAGVSYVH